MQHRIILPGATTLTRLISEVREKATLRLWNKLALIPSAEQRSQLEMLLGPTDCSRLSLLESLKKGPVTISGPAFNEAIERWKTLNDFGLHAENLSTLPAVRLKNLARYAGMTSVFNIARMSPQKRMAVLVAFVLAWETLALDDALDVLDAMLAVIIRDARKIGQKKRLRSLKDLDPFMHHVECHKTNPPAPSNTLHMALYSPDHAVIPAISHRSPVPILRRWRLTSLCRQNKTIAAETISVARSHHISVVICDNIPAIKKRLVNVPGKRPVSASVTAICSMNERIRTA